MKISKHFNLPAGHSNFDFVDIDTSYDTELFIDPCLIETIDDTFCQKCQEVINDYFDSFYNLYRNKCSYAEKIEMFSHAHEINATKLGYGSGNNGKAKTAEGMIETFEGISDLVEQNVPLKKAIDLPLFIRDFAEDCLSDMLTNVLFKELSEYTLRQCEIHSIPVEDITDTFYYWESSLHKWLQYNGKGLYIDGKLILLVPKYIVRHNYYYNTEQYFRSVILAKKQQEQTTVDNKGKEYAPTKKSIRETLIRTNGDVLTVSERETKADPLLLEGYHNSVGAAYLNRGMSDTELDFWTYGKLKS